jgi:hypothetical protein
MLIEMRDELAGGPRRRPLGEGMVMPVRKLVARIDGRAETLLPGRDRFHPDHPVVANDPRAFKPARAGDVAVRLRLAQLARARRVRPQRSPARGRAPAHLGGSKTWRLTRRSTSPDWRLS